MDSLTHIVVGACIGEAFLGKKLGKRAMLLGAVAQSVPDIDFVASFWMSNAENLLAHRGFTHSILFIGIITPLLAFLAERWHRPHNVKIRKWLLFFGIQGLIHILLDGFNAYGVGWLEPFDHHRFAFNTIFVADPFFAIWPFVAFLALLFTKRNNKTRVLWWLSGLIACGAYLLYTVSNKIYVDKTSKETLHRYSIVYDDYFSTPTPLNSWLWYVVAKTETGYYTGYRSVFDSQPTIALQFVPRNDSLLNAIPANEDIQHLKRFSKGYYAVEKRHDTLIFNDLRFGQVIGWMNPKEDFVFHYYLKETANNTFVMQRGRFAKWDRNVVIALMDRIRGN